MDINGTLIGQMITFAVFVWFTTIFVWPTLTEALESRKKCIVDGLAAAEKGQQALCDAKQNVQEILAEARQKSQDLLLRAHEEASQIIKEAKNQAEQEKRAMICLAEQQIAQSVKDVKTQLQAMVADLIVSGAEKLIRCNIHAHTQERVLQELIDNWGGASNV